MADRNPAPLVEVGIVGRPRGLAGELWVHLHDPTSRTLFEARTVVLSPGGGGSGTRRALLGAWISGKSLVIRLEGVTDRTQAQELGGQSIKVERASLPAPEPDEYYDCDLLGLNVMSTTGTLIGQVIDVEHPPANDVLVVDLGERRGFLDVPLVTGIVLSVDLETRQVTVQIPEGLPNRARR